MPVPLEDYLRTELAIRKYEIQQIGKTAASVLQQFHCAFDSSTNAWPYAVSLQSPDDTRGYSFSTNAMVLFALKAMLGSYQDRVATMMGGRRRLSWSNGNVALLTPMLALPDHTLITDSGDIADPSAEETAWEKLRGRLAPLTQKTEKRLLQHVNRDLTTNGDLTSSDTFGPNDPFTMCWLLESVSSRPPRRWIARAGNRVREAFEDPTEFRLSTKANVASTHALPLLRILHLSERLQQLELGRTIRPLAKIKDWFQNRIHEHLSYATIPDSSFDAPELIFALEGLLICEPQALGIARLLDRVIEVIHDKQEHNPNLRPYRPVLSDNRGQALLPLTIEVFTSLLRIFERLTSESPGVMKVDKARLILGRYARWLLAQRRTLRLASGSLSGWSSEHTNASDIVHVWETSQVLLFLVHYRSWLSHELQRELLEASNFSTRRPALKSYMPKTRAACVSSEPDRSVHLYRTIWARYIGPRLNQSSDPPSFSLLLYGPPGTGKTTFAEYLAGALGWDLITISPSDFIERGDQGVETRAKAIFRCLEELSEKVILFDEIDRLLLDRDSSEYEKQRGIFQFMTPSMLTKIRNLRRLRRCIFVVATNYEDRIDPAVKRSGRIDDRIVVLPPDRRCREKFLRENFERKQWRVKPTDPRWRSAVAKCALYTFEELQDAIRNSVESAGTYGEAMARLDDYLSERPRPDISLAAYAHRFGIEVENGKATAGRRPPQAPVDEYIKLYRIAREARNPRICDDVAQAALKVALELSGQ